MLQKYKTLMIGALTLISFTVEAQTKTVKDTLTLMHYNLLMYGAGGSACATFNTDVTYKDSQLKTLVEYIKPDVLTVNELGCNQAYTQRILQNCLKDLDGTYERVVMQDNGSQTLCNGVFYNTDKLGLLSAGDIDKGKTSTEFIRTIDLHNFYVKGPYLEEGRDTISYHHLVSHFKASQGTANVNERAYATEGIMYYLEQNLAPGNYVIAGDFNMYRASEAGYQNLVNYTNADYNFIDPIQQEGSWNNNDTYQNYHTQSTRSGRCGGMDDRFDIILASDDIMNNGKGIQYITDSYLAVGQDGNRFNGDIKNPVNQAVPSNIADALYEMSDHLPVVMKMEVSYEVNTSLSEASQFTDFQIINNGSNDVQLVSNSNKETDYKVTIFSIDGRLKHSENLEIRARKQAHKFHLERGIYVLNLTGENGDFQSYKITTW